MKICVKNNKKRGDKMNNLTIKCFYYAFNNKNAKKYYKYLKLKFEMLKFNKHFLKGKTTKKRKGKAEAKVSVARSNFRKICIILSLQKEIRKNNIGEEFLNGYSTQETLEEFLGIGR